MNIKKEKPRDVHLDLDQKYTSAEATRALKVVYNYLEQTGALNNNLLNKLNEINFVIETAENKKTKINK